MGSAYIFGLAQANLEINAVQGILIGAFIFVPLYLKEKVFTITEFIEKRLGKKIALFYSISNISLFSTITLGAALFWGAYATDVVFEDLLEPFVQNKFERITCLIVILGVISGLYTYLGGLNAVVKTDIIQFIIIIIGGIIVFHVSVSNLGGIEQLYEKTGEKMHLHLSANHPTLPWTHLLGLFFLNINYWCANQTIMQRAIAARNLKHAQIGLLAGGLIKYFMAAIIVLPGIALYGILGEGLQDPDLAFPYIVKNLLPNGFKGIILCGLFASLMSTLDSTLNSIATMWSTDIYSKYINTAATDKEKIISGRKSIIIALCIGLTVGIYLLYLKLDKPQIAFTHVLNNLRYYINCGIVLLICTSVLLIKPNKKIIFFLMVLSIPLNLAIEKLVPELNYFLRAFTVIISLLILSIFFSERKVKNIKSLFYPSSILIRNLGYLLLGSLIIIHFLFS
jgi:SSS family solute:Na+ symporter